jgi:predicted metalloprotease with PDZ domain
VRQGLFVAGEVEVLRRDVRGAPVVVAVATPEEGFDPDRFADLVARVVELERDFFDDFDQAPYLVAHLPVGTPDPRSLSLGGTGLQRAFACFTQRGERLEPGSRLYLPVVRLLVHEMFHEWNGQVVSRAAPEELLYWFSEGFTSFYTRRLAYRGGWIDAAAYAADLEEVLREHATTPARHATAQQVREGFWRDRDLQRLPYLRGDLLACLLDHAIRVRSDGERSLDDFLRSLVTEAYSLPGRRVELDTEGLLERVEAWAGPEAAARVRAVAVDGAPLELPADCFAPALALEPAEVATYELGFDLDRTRAEGVIRGVTPGSAAERAGLREGERLAGLSLRPGRADVAVEVTVGEPGAERSVSYLPRGEALPGQAVRLLDEAAGQGLL